MNTVCVDPSEMPSECPIIDIQFLTDTKGYENYIQIPYGNLTLAYTKS